MLRKKGEKDIPSPHILQAPAPVPVLGGGHVAADFLAGVLTDKFVYHIPEYRQVKMYADAGVKLSTSTLNDWVHRTAGKLYPLYETLIDAILMEGISPEASRRKRLQAVSPSPPDGGSEKSPSSSQNTCIKSWLSR